MAAKYIVMRCASNSFQTDKLAVFVSPTINDAERMFHSVIRPYVNQPGWTYTLHQELPQHLDQGVLLFFIDG